MADLDITGRVVFDASQAEGALDGVSRKAGKFAVDMTQAGESAGKGLAKIGEIATANGEKFTKVEGSIINQIKRIVGEAAKAQPVLDKLGDIQFNIAAKGLDAAKFAPYIDVVKSVSKEAQDSVNALAAASSTAGTAASGALNKIGVSAAQTANALRGVPAQFTDIVTSLQGGQAPLTVFLQQGGQLKDMFGGAGNAARALGGYVLGLVNPFTAAAAAIGAVGFAYYKGAQEIKAFENALALSGNASGVTVDQMRQLATTTGASADALAQFARAGVTGTEGLQKFSEAAVRFENFTGIAVNESVAAWKSLGDEPVKSALKLNDTISFLTPTIYGQIKALNDQGKAFEAAALAQDAFASAQQRISDGAESKLNAVSYGWDQIAKSIGGAWKALKDFTNGDSVDKRIGASQATISSATQGLEMARARGQDDRVAQYQKIIDAETKHLSMLQSGLSLEKGVAAEKAEQNKRLDGQVAFDREHDKYLSKSVERERELAVLRQNAARANNGLQAIVDYGGAGADAARKTLLENQKKLAEAEAGIGKKYEEKSSSPAKAQSEYDKLIASIKAKIALNEAEIATGEKQNEADKLRISLMAQIEQGSRKMTAAQLDDAQAQLRSLEESEKAKALYLSQKKFEKERDKEDQSIAADIAKINERAQALEDEAKVYGMTATELQALTIARLEEKKALISGFDGSEKRVAQINDEIAALNRLASAGVGLADAKLADKTSEMLRDAKAQSAIYEQENSLSGLTALERAKITAQRKVEYEYAKKIADVDKSGASDAAKTEAKRDLNEAKLIASSAAVNKVVQDEWQKTADSINNSLTDALLRGFESGKDFAANMRDTVVNMFKTLVLRPIISAVVNPLAGALTGALGLAGSASAATGGASSLGGIGAAIGTMGMLFQSFGTGMAASFSSAMSAGVGGWATAAGSLIGTGTASGIAAGVGMVAAPVAAILALKSVMQYSVESKGSGITATIGGASGLPSGQVGMYREFEQTGGFLGGGTTTNRDWAKADQGVADYISKSVALVTASNKAYAASIGLTSGSIDSFTKNIEVNITGLDAAGQKAKIDKELLKFAGDQAAAAFGDSVKQFAIEGENTAQTIARLATDLTVVNRTFADLGLTMFDVSVGGAAAAAGIVDLMGGLEQFSALTSEYFRNFYSEGEQRNAQAEYIRRTLAEGGINVTVDQILGGSREQFRQLVEAQDLSTESGRKAYASLMKVNGAFANLTPTVDSAATATNEAAQRAAEAAARESQRAAEAAAAEARRQAEAYAAAFKSAQDYISGIADNIKNFLAGLDAQAEGLQSYNKVAAAFSAQMVLAKGGDRNSLDGITNTASTLIDVIRRESASQSEANLRIGRVRGQLSGLPAQLSPEQFIVDGLSTVITTSTTTTGTTITTAAASIVSGYTSAIDGLIGALDTGFASIDIDTSGGITLAEMQTALAGKATDGELARLFDLIDVDNNGILSKLETANAQTNTFGAQVFAALHADFDKLDTSVNNALDFSEFSAGLTGLASDSELRKIFAELDTNGDGVISRLESLHAATTSVHNATLRAGDNIVSLRLDGLKFDPNDPLRSIFDATKTAAEASANIWFRVTSGTLGVYTTLAREQNAQAAKDLGHNAWAAASEWQGSAPYVRIMSTTGQAYAQGGVFTNSVVSSPTLFDQSLMGEAGPEAIMPLKRTSSGDLGVQMVMPNFANYGNGGQSQAALVGEIRALRTDNQAQARSLVQLQQRMNKLLERWDGNGMPEVRVVA